MPEERWRCFVAVPVDEEFRQAALSARAALQRSMLNVDEWRWVDPERLHLTLAFIGNTATSTLPTLAERLGSAARGSTAMTVVCDSIGAFPSPLRARVLWYGIRDSGGHLRSLATGVRVAIGVSEDHPFRAHITLARMPSHGGVDARSALSASPPRVRLRVASIVLYRSLRGHGGEEYQQLGAWTLR